MNPESRVALKNVPRKNQENRSALENGHRMNEEPLVIIRIDGEGHVHRPGETLSGEYWIELLKPCQVAAIEVSVMWHTEGKGEEDMAVHDFWRQDAAADLPLDPARPKTFRTTLPNSPLSYDGQIVKLLWCVRVRAFLHRGKEIVGEKEFRLGNIPRPAAAHAGEA
jgi:hypothetical protein